MKLFRIRPRGRGGDPAGGSDGRRRIFVTGATGYLGRAIVIRPGIVYGGAGGLIGRFFASAERDGAAAIVGDGRNRWTPVHRQDMARPYRLVIEARAAGIFHCAEDAAVPVAELARAASEAAGRGGEVRAIPLEEARRTMGAEADALVLDQHVLAVRARELGWRPERGPFMVRVDETWREWLAERAEMSAAG